MPELTRRQIFAGIAVSALVIAGGGTIGIMQDHRAELVRDILRRTVGDFRMADDQFAAMLDDIDQPFAPSRPRLAFYRATSVAGPEPLREWGPQRIGREFEEYERRVVTVFVTRTDYLSADPAMQNVRFIGGDACSSPFARFT